MVHSFTYTGAHTLAHAHIIIMTNVARQIYRYMELKTRIDKVNINLVVKSQGQKSGIDFEQSIHNDA